MKETKWMKESKLSARYEVVTLTRHDLEYLVKLMLTLTLEKGVAFKIEDILDWDTNTVAIKIDFSSLTSEDCSVLEQYNIRQTDDVFEQTHAILTELFGSNYDFIQLSVNTLQYQVFIFKPEGDKVIMETPFGDIEARAFASEDYKGIDISFVGDELFHGGGLTACIEVNETEKTIKTYTYDGVHDEPTECVEHSHFIMKETKGEVVIEDLAHTIDVKNRAVVIETPCKEHSYCFRFLGRGEEDWGHFIENNSQEVEEWLFECGYSVIADYRADLLF